MLYGVRAVSAFTGKNGKNKREAATPVAAADDMGTKKTAESN